MITVFTPTYNRSKYLTRLYESLVHQTCSNFEWVVVDDGSVDDTELLIQSFVQEDKIKIKLITQANKGKHIAINTGLDNATGEWFFIVDSDDYLIPEAVEIINKYISQRAVENLEGFAFRRANSKGQRIGDAFPAQQTEFVGTMLERTIKYKVQGDMAEVFKTTLLQQCKFDIVINEKFCAEGLMWNRTSRRHAKILFVDIPIYICEYLEGGLTHNSIANRRLSPTYATLLYKELAENPDLPLKYKARAYINYWRFAPTIQGSLLHQIPFKNNRLLSLLCMPLGWLVKFKDDMILKKNG